jgi:VWFA-related protein
VSGPGDPASVRGALGSLEAIGSTAVHDALFAGIAVASAAPGRPFVVLFSDGIERCSWLDDDRVLEAARHAEATVYHVNPNWIAPFEAPPISDETGLAHSPVRHRLGPRSPSPIIGKSVSATGGRAWNGRFGRELEESFERILAEVQSRYVLMYEPEGPQRPGWHTLQVKLRKRSGEVRARRGYYVTP